VNKYKRNISTRRYIHVSVAVFVCWRTGYKSSQTADSSVVLIESSRKRNR